MDAEEHVGVQLLFEARHGLAEQMGLVLGADSDVVLLGRDPANVGDRKKDDSSAGFEDDTRGVVVSGLTGRTVGGRLIADKDLLTSSFDGRGESLLGKGLEQIVHCVNLEGSQRILIVRGGKDDVRLWVEVAGTQLAGDIEAIHAGHLDVEKEQLRFGGADQIDGFAGSGAFPNHVYFGLVAQELTELLSSQDFIIS